MPIKPVVAALVAAFLLLGYLAGDAWSHWLYERHCCDVRDCAPVADKIVTETPEGFTLNDTGEFVERGSPKIRKPINEEYHVCRNPAGVLLCIYPRLSGS